MGRSFVNIGIIGCGRIARTRHIPEYAANKNARIAGFYNRTFGTAKELADAYNGRAYTSVEELLADPSIDAVSVLTPNNTHADISIAALRAGKHVLCEKPMAVTPETCKQLAAAEKAYPAKLMIAQNQRFNPAHVTARDMIASGEIGDVLTFRTGFSHSGPSADPNAWFLNPKFGGLGVMGDLGVHKVDLIRFLTRQDIAGVSAVLGTLDKSYENGEKINLDDNAICIFKLTGGAIGTMTVSWTAYGKPDVATLIYGTRGTIELYRNFTDPLVLYRPGYDPQRIDVAHNESSGVVDAFIDCIVSDSPSPIPVSSVIPSMKAVFAAYESSRNGSAMIHID